MHSSYFTDMAILYERKYVQKTCIPGLVSSEKLKPCFVSLLFGIEASYCIFVAKEFTWRHGVCVDPCWTLVFCVGTVLPFKLAEKETPWMFEQEVGRVLWTPHYSQR